MSNPTTYAAMHLKVRRVRDEASLYSCVDCSVTASQWSCPHDKKKSTSIVKTKHGQRIIAFSRKVSDYLPRCVSCHARYDNDSRGSRNGNSKLDEEKVLDIRYLFDSGTNRQEIADYFAVSLSTVNKIGARDYWSHVPEEIVGR